MADELQVCLEGLQGGRSLEDVISAFPEDAKALRGLLGVASRIQETATDLPAAPFRGLAKGRLLRRINPVNAGGQAFRPRRSWRLAFAFSAIGTLLLVLFVGGGISIASAQSLPGDPLYDVKLVEESAVLAFPRSPASRAALELSYAELRIREIRLLAARGRLGESAEPLDAASQHLESATIILEGLGQPALEANLSGKLGLAARDLSETVDLVSSSQPSSPGIGAAEQAGRHASQVAQGLLKGLNPSEFAPGKSETPQPTPQGQPGKGKSGAGQGHQEMTPNPPNGHGSGPHH